VNLGQNITGVLERLGNPNKEYHKGDVVCLNYFELGVDIIIQNQDYSVSKIIAHANNVNMPDFCFYDRCFFELLLVKNVEMKLPEDEKDSILEISKI